MSTHTTSEDVFENFLGRVESLNKKARRLGIDDIKVTETGRKRHDADTGEVFFEVTFDVTGTSVQLPGDWSLVCRIEHDPQVGTLVHAVPGVTVPPKYWKQEAAPVCNHCNTKRRRSDTFVVVNRDGEYKQVGRNCLVDFLGHDTPHSILQQIAFTEQVLSFLGDDPSDHEYSGRTIPLYSNGMMWRWHNLSIMLSRVACLIRHRGWMGRGKAKETYGEATIDLLFSIQSDIRNGNQRDIQLITPSDKDRDNASKAIEWAASLSGDQLDSEYLANIQKIAQADMCSWKQAGIAASIMIAHANHLEREMKLKNAPTFTDGYLAAVGERVEVKAKVLSSRAFEGDYGVTTLVKFVSESGHALTWWASRGLDFEEGEELRVKGTVKKLDEYEGTKQTVLTRCRCN